MKGKVNIFYQDDIFIIDIREKDKEKHFRNINYEKTEGTIEKIELGRYSTIIAYNVFVSTKFGIKNFLLNEENYKKLRIY